MTWTMMTRLAGSYIIKDVQSIARFTVILALITIITLRKIKSMIGGIKNQTVTLNEIGNDLASDMT